MNEFLKDGIEVNLNTINLNEELKNLNHDEEYVVSKKNSDKASAPYGYTAYGNGKKLRKKDAESSINIIKAMLKMSKAAQRVFDALNDKMLTNDHIGGIIKISYTDTIIDKDSWNKGINELLYEDFIRRTAPRSKYIINPKLLVPTGDPTIHSSSITFENKTEAHKKYIKTIMDNWNKAITK
jgi:hypothetical protein